MIITVSREDTLELLSAEYGIPVEKIISDNGIVGFSLVPGQALIILPARRVYIPTENTTVSEVADEFGTDSKTIFRNNFFLKGQNDIPIGSYVVIEYQSEPERRAITGGYAYDFISTKRLSSVINYLTYIMPFTYGFTPEANLVVPDDEYILSVAGEASVKPLMHISTLTENDVFDSNLPGVIFGDSEKESLLIENIVNNVNQKGYYGADVDFEYLPAVQKQNYADFIMRLSQRLHADGKILVVAVPPKTSDEQAGLLVEGIDYEALAAGADYVLIMAYEYGYKFGPPLAIAPVNQIRRVLDYALTKMPSEKILLGISNYGYDWTLPYIRGESDAPSISTVEAVELAKKYGADIMFDEVSQAPFFFYTDENGYRHEVWYEDARSFAAKFELIEQYNLAGGFIWDLMRDNPQGFVTMNSLVKI